MGKIFSFNSKLKPLSIIVEASSEVPTIKIEGPISQWRDTCANFENQVSALITKGHKDVKIYLNTPGGDCFEANEIANIIARFPGTITGEGGAMVASAGTYIACKCTTFHIAPNGQYMIHKPGMYTAGNSDEIKADLKLLENLEADYLATYAAQTKLPPATIESLWGNDYWMNAEEAIKKGFVHGKTAQASAITKADYDAAASFNYKNIPLSIAAFAVTPKQEKSIMKIILSTAHAAIAKAFNKVFEAGKDTIEVDVTTEMINDLNAKVANVDALNAEITQLRTDLQTANDATAASAAALKDAKAEIEKLKTPAAITNPVAAAPELPLAQPIKEPDFNVTSYDEEKKKLKAEGKI